MKKIRPRSKRGDSMIEFCLLGVPVIFITVSVASISINMWSFHNLAWATESTARYVSLHGANCSINGNTCSLTVGKVATYFHTQGMALDASQVTVTLTDGSGTTTCNPLNTCLTSATQFPNAIFNAVGDDISIKATYTLKNPIALYWPPTSSSLAQNFTVSALSRQRIVF